MFIDKPGNYGNVTLTGKDPSLFQDDVALRIRSKGLIRFGTLTITDCGMPIRHEAGRIIIDTLICKRFTADLWNSIGDIEILNLHVEMDGSKFTEDDYDNVHPDALGQFFNHTTKKVKNVKIHNIYAKIRGKLIQGMMLSEGHDYSNFRVGTGTVDVQMDYRYGFVANTLRNSFVNIGSNGVKIVDSKGSSIQSGRVEVIKNFKEQEIYTDFDPWINHDYQQSKGISMDTKIALIVGHNARSQGAMRQGITEYEFWNEFFEDHLDDLNESAKANGIELKVFNRIYQGPRTYTKEMREVHSRIDAWGGDVSIECHYNGFNGKAEGHEVLYYNESKGGSIAATAMDKAMDTWLENKDRNRKPVTLGQNGSSGLRVGGARSILIEPFFGQEIEDFLPYGDQRENLVNVFKTFFLHVDKVNKGTNDVTQIPNRHLTDEELAIAMEILL